MNNDELATRRAQAIAEDRCFAIPRAVLHALTRIICLVSSESNHYD